MKALLLVGLGGALGSMARYSIAALLLHGASPRFPFGTLTVNTLGCLIAGALAALAERQAWMTPDVRAFVFIGLLGGFTTFSAFGLETLTLLRRNEAGLAGMYVLASLLLGLFAAWLGWKLAAR